MGGRGSRRRPAGRRRLEAPRARTRPCAASTVRAIAGRAQPGRERDGPPLTLVGRVGRGRVYLLVGRSSSRPTLERHSRRESRGRFYGTRNRPRLERAGERPLVDPLLPPAAAPAAGLRHRRDDHGPRPAGSHVLRPDVLHHRRVPPVLRPPQLQARARRAVRDGLRRGDGVPEGRALVGGSPPASSPVRRHRARSPLAPEGLLVEPRRMDPLRQVLGDRHGRDQGFRPLPRAAVPRQARLDPDVDASASRAS